MPSIRSISIRATLASLVLATSLGCGDASGPSAASFSFDDAIGDPESSRPGTASPMDVRRISGTWSKSTLRLQLEFSSVAHSFYTGPGGVGGTIWLNTDMLDSTGWYGGRAHGADFGVELSGAINDQGAFIIDATQRIVATLPIEYRGNTLTVDVPTALLSPARSTATPKPAALGRQLRIYGAAQSETHDDYFPETGWLLISR